MQTVFGQIRLRSPYCSSSPYTSPEAGADPGPFFFLLAVSCLQSYKEHSSALKSLEMLRPRTSYSLCVQRTKYVTQQYGHSWWHVPRLGTHTTLSPPQALPFVLQCSMQTAKVTMWFIVLHVGNHKDFPPKWPLTGEKKRTKLLSSL